MPIFRFKGKTVLFLLFIFCAANAQWVTVKTFHVSSAAFGDISCPDKNTCFVIGNISVYRTQNGGTTWDSLGANGLGGPNIWFTDTKTGFACGSNGGIWATKNAGASWTMVRGINTTDGCQAYLFNDIFFPTPAKGFAVGQFGAVLKTQDSGTTWTCSVHNGPDLNAVFFTDTSSGWAVGSAGRIMHTVDGGGNWPSQISGTSADLNCVFFINDSLGFAAGGGTSCVLVVTTDGGAGWQVDSTGIPGPALALWFTSNTVGFIAATGGVYRTRNAGTTWAIMTGGLSNPSGLCFPDASTGYEVSSSGVVAKYNGTGVLWPVSIKVSAGIRVFYDAKGIIIRMDHTRLHNIDASLYDLRGRIVAKVSGEAGNAVRIPTASLGSGMFLLSLNDRNGTSCTIPMVLP